MATTTPRRPSSASQSLYGTTPSTSAGPSRRSMTPRMGTPGAGAPSRFTRRPSAFSALRSPSQGSSMSGTGKRRGYGAPKDDRDWAGMEPDEVFRRLPVNEVKRVESKMRADALNKQSELRSMVGTRYRDLLTSASQITSLHESSLRLSEGLRTVAAACENPTELPADTESEPDDEGTTALLPVAAHMKLLLDAPEALYTHLAHHAYLDAAFLWLVSRVVKEGLAATPEDTLRPYTPLLQKQWEVLLPFRSQIVQRATAALRTRDKLDTRTVSDTLLAVILLDSLPLSEALDLLLSQRLRALRDILSNVQLKRARRMSKVDPTTREAALPREDITHAIAEAVQSLLDAVTLAKGVFEAKRKVTGDGESMLAESIRLVQEGETVRAVSSQSTPMRSKGHQRRASRLASISLPLPPRLGPTLNSPPVSTPRVIQALPSSQILLRYLPAPITGFTPFITPSPAPVLADKLGPWQASAVELLRESVPAWLAGLHSVSDLWAVRSAMRDLLGDGAFEKQINAALESEWATRVQAIWTAKLDVLVRSAESALKGAGDQIRSGEETQDNVPEHFMFSDIDFPSTVAMGAGNTAVFDTFLSTLRQRAAFRTPLLDDVLGVLESAATDINADLADLPASLYDDYRTKVTHALDALVDVLGDVLAAVGGHRDATGSVEAELFIGRVALYLVHTSRFLPDLIGDTGVDLEPVKTQLMEIHANSTIQWQGKTVAAAVETVYPLFHEHRGEEQIRATWQGPAPTQPSGPLITALTQLVAAVRRLGIPANVSAALPTVPGLVGAFCDEVRALDGWETQTGAGAAQAAVDLGFLALLNGADPTSTPSVQQLIASLPPAFDTFKADLPAVLNEALRRTQLVLFPLTQHLPAVAREKRHGPDGRTAALLRLGAPALAGRAGGVGEFKSPIAVARPGKRFGLLSIVA